MKGFATQFKTYRYDLAPDFFQIPQSFFTSDSALYNNANFLPNCSITEVYYTKCRNAENITKMRKISLKNYYKKIYWFKNGNIWSTPTPSGGGARRDLSCNQTPYSLQDELRREEAAGRTLLCSKNLSRFLLLRVGERG